MADKQISILPDISDKHSVGRLPEMKMALALREPFKYYFADKSWQTFSKAKLFARSARDNVDTTIDALVRKLSMKVARRQGVGDISNHFLAATLRRHVLGLHHSFGEKE